METLNGISIVVATKGRVALLEELLQGIQAARERFDKPCEVILVDDSSPAEQKQILLLCEKYDAIFENYTNSVAMKRTHGVEVSRYELILFLDSDCKPVPELLNLHARAYGDAGVGAAVGPLEFVGEENRFWKCVTLTPFLICFKMPCWGDTVPWGATANFSVRRDVFEKIGGFSSDFPNKPGGEDVDLGIMITKAGYIIKSLPEAVVYHAKATWSTVRPMFRRAWWYGFADYYLVDRHLDMTCDAVPRRTMISLGMSLFFVLTAVLRSPWLLLGIPLWILLDILVMSAIMCRVGFEKSRFGQQLVVQLLIIVNELGYVFNCAKHGKFSYIRKQIVYFDNQIKGLMTNGYVTFWRFLIGYAVLLVLLAVSMGAGLI